MAKHTAALVSVAMTASLLASSALAAGGAYGTDRRQPKGTQELPQCASPIGTVAIQEPDRDWWTAMGLSNPEALLKLFAGRSNCLRVVARGQVATAMRQQERDLGNSGELQRGSNFGKGQVIAADYLIIPDIVDTNGNAGGGGLGGAALSGLGRGLGSRFGGFGGAMLGSINIKSSNAHTLITLVNARTTEQEYVAEGTAQKTDVGFGGGGFGSSWGVIGGGYSNTDIGKVVAAAYFNAFVDLVDHMQGTQPGAAQAAAPIQAYTVKMSIPMLEGADVKAHKVRDFSNGDLVYPTGKTNGVWWEVDDENGNRGWISSAHITPRG